MAIPTVLALRGQWHVLRRNLNVVGLFGLLAVAGAQVGFFNAVRYLPIGVALLLEYLGIILVVVWMWLVHGQRPRRLTVAGSVAALLGLVLVLDLTGGGRIDPIGVLFGLGAGVGLATYFVLSARIDPELPSVAVAGTGMALGAGILLGLGALGALPLHATFGAVDFAGSRMSWLVPIIGLSLIAAVIPYVAGIGAARILGARLASFVGLTEVIFAVLVAWLLLGELPTTIQLLGGVLIMAGVTLVRMDELRQARIPFDLDLDGDALRLRPPSPASVRSLRYASARPLAARPATAAYAIPTASEAAAPSSGESRRGKTCQWVR